MSGTRHEKIMKTQRSSLSAAHLCPQDVTGRNQITKGHPPAHDAGSAPAWSLSSASSGLTMENRERPASGRIEYDVLQPSMHLISSSCMSQDTSRWIPEAPHGRQQGGVIVSDISQDAALVSAIWKPAASSTSKQLVGRVNHDNYQGSILEHSMLYYSPSSPESLLVVEDLLRNTNVYFETLCRAMPLNTGGMLVNPDGTELRNDLCSDFDSHCFTATMFHKKNLSKKGLSLELCTRLIEPVLLSKKFFEPSILEL